MKFTIFDVKYFSILFFSLLLSGSILGQIGAKKKVTAIRTNNPPKIDADLNDEAWKGVPVATGFVQHRPYNGRSASLKSEVKFVYDDIALYVGAMLYDPHPDSILTELSERDDIGVSDYFGVYIDCFNDYLTAYGFLVTSRGVQIDLKSLSDDDEDDSWDAVWKSEVKITDSGWIVEYKIPYSALRFPKKDVQTWGLQIYRDIMRYKEHDSWNFIDRKIDGINLQSGILEGVRDIVPPLRLSFVPYLSGYIEKDPHSPSWGYSYNYGLDVKYGINESFTLDMTLIPDFGQVQADDEIYNLSPFEVYYDEKRPFFMEGTELFDKGDVFYSRRIGSKPSGYYNAYYDLEENEIVTDNPSTTQLINAAKITGKTKKNLAVGVFNGITANTYAKITDTITGSERKYLSEPYTNYNMIVLDQSFKNNSYVSLYNTNVYKPDAGFSANVSSTEFKLNNNTNKYAVEGQASISQIYNSGFHPELGYTYSLSAGKVSGNFTFDLSHELIDDKYNPNHMGFLRHNNLISDELSLGYKVYEPFGIFLDLGTHAWFEYRSLYNPREFTQFDLGVSTYARFTNFLSAWFRVSGTPVDSYDFYEPRVDGRYYVRPPGFKVKAGVSPDYRKKLVIDLKGTLRHSPRYNQSTYSFNTEPRFRANDKLMLSLEVDYAYSKNSIGYVDDTTGTDGNQDILFGKRNIDTWENILKANYKFNNKSSLSLRLRHYWITVEYNSYHDLTEEGGLLPSEYNELNDFSFNAFNVDMVYIWNFAPGSEINIVWKNAITTFEEPGIINSILYEMESNYFRNLGNTLQSPATNSFSIKVLYYFDYQYLKRRKKKKG
jgi:hypothetical protein